MAIKEVVGFKGDLVFGRSKLDGTPRKLLDVYKLNSLCWEYKINLYDGIKMTYEWYAEKMLRVILMPELKISH
ncbi:MAG: hypothetical protein N2645_09950 [Clostridia bacterium]|nr:hypothetical protein [Clostridia bacterium]